MVDLRTIYPAFVEKYGKPTTVEAVGDILRHELNAKAVKMNTHLVGLAFDVRLDKIGASHNAPVGKRTSFSTPERYRGYRGRVWVRLHKDPREHRMSVHDMFHHTLTHAGSGGGGDYESPWSMTYKMWWERFGNKQARDYQHILGPNRTARLYRPSLWGWTFHFFYDDWPDLRHADAKRKMLTDIAGTQPETNFRYRWDCEAQAHVDDMFQWEQEAQQAWRAVTLDSTYKNHERIKWGKQLLKVS